MLHMLPGFDSGGGVLKQNPPVCHDQEEPARSSSAKAASGCAAQVYFKGRAARPVVSDTLTVPGTCPFLPKVRQSRLVYSLPAVTPQIPTSAAPPCARRDAQGQLSPGALPALCVLLELWRRVEGLLGGGLVSGWLRPGQAQPRLAAGL